MDALGRSDLDPAVRQRIAFVHIYVCMWWHALSWKAPEYIISNKNGRSIRRATSYMFMKPNKQFSLPSWFFSVHHLVFLLRGSCHCKNKQENLSKKVMRAASSSKITTWTILESSSR